MKVNNIFISAICIASVALCSCSDEIFDIEAPAVSDDIRFKATLSDSWPSRSDANGEMEYEAVPMTARTTGDSLFLTSEILDWTSPAEGTSRSNMVHSTGGMYDSFNVSAYHYTTEWDSTISAYQPNYFYYESASGSMASGYAMDSKRLWPSTGKMRFIAFAPFSTWNTGAYVLANVDGSTGTYVHIEVDSVVSKHQDLLVAYTEEIDCSGAAKQVALNFKHALCCVQFVLADDMEDCRIKNISIKNVKYWGDMRFRDNMAEPTARSSADASLNDSYYPWDGTRNFTLDLADGSNANGAEVSSGDLITDENHSFMMFPQVLPDNAMVEITLSRKADDGTWGSEEVMYGYISAKRWPAGKIVRYRVSKDRWWQQLMVSNMPAFPPFGGDQYFSITSYDTDTEGKMTGVEWVAEYEDPNAPGTFTSTPSWFTLEMAANSAGDVDPRQIKVTAQSVPVSYTVDLNAKLKAVGSYGTEANPYNLTTGATGTADIGSTANCYVVDRPGWYIFPLVYGNAIENGSQNTPAFKPNTGGANSSLNNFLNHLGQEISSPYILTDCPAQAGVTASSAAIIWQDKQNLIRTVAVDKTAFGGKGGIKFQIQEGDIAQGNVAIGLQSPTDAGAMMWSWHIWVTPFLRTGLDPIITESISITNHTSRQFDMMFVNLGWCSLEPIKIYSPRSSRVRFTATTSDGRTRVTYLDVKQSPFVEYWHGYNTYYQWGRKDPFQPFVKSWNQMPYWTGEGSTGATWYPPSADLGYSAEGLKNRIQKPNTFHQVPEIGSIPEGPDKMFTNLWDATFADVPFVNKYEPTRIEILMPPTRNNVKSVYDPCPAGFKVPPIDTFTGFTNTGNNIGALVDNPKNWNGVLSQYTYDCGGDPDTQHPYIYLFYTDTKQDNYIAIPSMGYRDWRNYGGNAGQAINMGQYGYLWTAASANESEGYYLEVRKNPSGAWVAPIDYFWHTDAFPLRPCRE